MPYNTFPSKGALLLYFWFTIWKSLIQLLEVSEAIGR